MATSEEYNSELTRIQTAKADLAAAIEEQGVTVPEGTQIDGMASLVRSIKRQINVPRNLLDNSDFTNPVNQRGVTTNWTVGYGIDRWGGASGGVSVSVTSDGLAIQNPGVAAAAYIQQNLDDALFNKLVGKSLTAAVCLSDGTIGVATKICAEGMELQARVTGGDVRVRKPSNGPFMCRIVNTVLNSTITVKWVALYEGSYTADTLPEYVPKGYSEELRECQRYYYATPARPHIAANGFSFSATEVRATYTLPVPMRANPTLTVATLSEARVYCAGATATPNQAITTAGWAENSNQIGLVVKVASTTANHAAAVRFNCAVSFSADL